MDKVEFLILRNLLYNEEYVRKVIPFIKSEYFEDQNQKIVFEEILTFVQQYNQLVTKEITDALNEKEVRDMTKSQLIKGAFRMLTLKLGQANVPLIVTNHTYDVIGAYVPTKEMGGGSGLKYAASTIIYLSKKKEKDGTEVVGNIIKAKTAKSRLSKENKDVEIRLYYDDRGLDRYYGLLELGEIGGLWKNVAGRYEIDGKKLYAKQILKEPEVYFTPEVMEQLDQIARKEFSYGEG